jgi:hypothetical protein
MAKHSDLFVDHVVTNVSVEWILKNVATSIDLGSSCTQCGKGEGYCDHNTPEVDWQCFIDSKVGWDISLGVGMYVEMAQEFIDHGGMDNPICLTWTGDHWMMGNGHHRLSLAILLCMESVPVVFSLTRNEYMMSWATTGWGGLVCEDPDNCTCLY